MPSTAVRPYFPVEKVHTFFGQSPLSMYPFHYLNLEHRIFFIFRNCSSSVRHEAILPCLLFFFSYKEYLLLWDCTIFPNYRTRFWASFACYSFFRYSGTKLPKMLSPSSLGSIALVVYILSGRALSYRAPVDEVVRKEFQKRLLCVQDDVLDSFQAYSEDAIPFCSSYLSIPLSTSTVSLTSRTSEYPCPISAPIR